MIVNNMVGIIIIIQVNNMEDIIIITQGLNTHWGGGGRDIHKNTQGNKQVIFVVCKNCYKDHPTLIVRELIKAKNSLICAKI